MRNFQVSYMEARGMLVWEYNQRMQGLKDKDRAEWLKVGRIAATILAPHLKKGKRITPWDFMPYDKPKKERDPEAIKKDVEHKLKAFDLNGK